MEKDFSFIHNLPFILQGDNVWFYLYARNGLFYGVNALRRIKPNKKVILVPEYSCGDEIAAIQATGVKTVSFKVNPISLNFDKEDLMRKLEENKHTLLGVLVIHYFSELQHTVSFLKEVCAAYDCFLIEDSAHILPISGKSKAGKYGDIAIFSLRKLLPVPHGGALVVNNKELNISAAKSAPADAVEFDITLYLLQKAGVFPQGYSIEKMYKRMGYDIDRHGPRVPQFGGYQLGLSDIVKLLLKHGNTNDNLYSRIETFRHYLKFFSKNKSNMLTPLYNSIDGLHAPLCFPLRTKLSSEYIYSQLLDKHKIPIVSPLWSLNTGNRKASDNLKHIRACLLSLPVSTRYNDSQLNTLIQQIEKIA